VVCTELGKIGLPNTWRTGEDEEPGRFLPCHVSGPDHFNIEEALYEIVDRLILPVEAIKNLLPKGTQSLGQIA
jgi:hypothetical protein